MHVHLLQIESLLHEEFVGKLKCILDHNVCDLFKVHCDIFVPLVAVQMELQSSNGIVHNCVHIQCLRKLFFLQLCLVKLVVQ